MNKTTGMVMSEHMDNLGITDDSTGGLNWDSCTFKWSESFITPWQPFWEPHIKIHWLVQKNGPMTLECKQRKIGKTHGSFFPYMYDTQVQARGKQEQMFSLHHIIKMIRQMGLDSITEPPDASAQAAPVLYINTERAISTCPCPSEVFQHSWRQIFYDSSRCCVIFHHSVVRQGFITPLEWGFASSSVKRMASKCKVAPPHDSRLI